MEPIGKVKQIIDFRWNNLIPFNCFTHLFQCPLYNFPSTIVAQVGVGLLAILTDDVPAACAESNENKIRHQQ